MVKERLLNCVSVECCICVSVELTIGGGRRVKGEVGRWMAVMVSDSNDESWLGRL